LLAVWVFLEQAGSPVRTAGRKIPALLEIRTWANAVAIPLADIFRMPLGQIPVFRFSWRDALAYKLYGPWLFLQQRD
jgi:hypothetical protein